MAGARPGRPTRAVCASTGTPSTWATRAAPPARRTSSAAPRPCTSRPAACRASSPRTGSSPPTAPRSAWWCPPATTRRSPARSPARSPTTTRRRTSTAPSGLADAKTLRRSQQHGHQLEHRGDDRHRDRVNPRSPSDTDVQRPRLRRLHRAAPHHDVHLVLGLALQGGQHVHRRRQPRVLPGQPDRRLGRPRRSRRAGRSSRRTSVCRPPAAATRTGSTRPRPPRREPPPPTTRSSSSTRSAWASATRSTSTWRRSPTPTPPAWRRPGRSSAPWTSGCTLRGYVSGIYSSSQHAGRDPARRRRHRRRRLTSPTTSGSPGGTTARRPTRRPGDPGPVLGRPPADPPVPAAATRRPTAASRSTSTTTRWTPPSPPRSWPPRARSSRSRVAASCTASPAARRSYVSTWESVGGVVQPVQTLSQTQFDSLPDRPDDGTFLQSGATGLIWRTIKGVATFVPSWAPYGGPKPTIVVDQAALDNAGTGGVWNLLTSGKPAPRMTGPTTLGTVLTKTPRSPGSAATPPVAVATYDVRCRKARWDGSFGSWTRPASWQGTTVDQHAAGPARRLRLLRLSTGPQPGRPALRLVRPAVPSPGPGRQAAQRLLGLEAQERLDVLQRLRAVHDEQGRHPGPHRRQGEAGRSGGHHLPDLRQGRGPRRRQADRTGEPDLAEPAPAAGVHASCGQARQAHDHPAGAHQRADRPGRRTRPQPDVSPPHRGTPPGVRCRHGPPDLRAGERVRRHVHVQGTAAALAGRGGALPVPPGRVVGTSAATSSCATAPGSTSTSGSHPEYATPECDDIRELVIHDKAGERILEGPAGRRRAAAARGGHRRRRLPVQEQHRLGRQLLRLPRELPGRPARRVHPAGRHPDPVPRQPADHLRRRQGAADPARRRLLREPAGRAHLGGRLVGDDPVAPDHQHPRRAARRRRALPPAARDRRRLEHERDDDAAQARRDRPRAADDRGQRRDARPDAGEPDPGDPRDQPRHHRAAQGAAGQRSRGERAGDPGGVLHQGARLRRPARARRGRRQAGARPLGAHPAAPSRPATSTRSAPRSTG